MKPILFILSGYVAFGQSAYVPNSSAPTCAANQIGKWTATPGTGSLSGYKLVEFSCVQLDPSVTTDATTTPPTIKAKPVTPPVCPSVAPLVARVEVINPVTPNILLQNVPAPNTVLLAFWNSNYIGYGRTLAIQNPTQNIVLSVPQQLSTTDTVTLVYWSN